MYHETKLTKIFPQMSFALVGARIDRGFPDGTFPSHAAAFSGADGALR